MLFVVSRKLNLYGNYIDDQAPKDSNVGTRRGKANRYNYTFIKNYTFILFLKKYFSWICFKTEIKHSLVNWNVTSKKGYHIKRFTRPQAYPEPGQTSKMKFFAKIVNGWKPLTIFAKALSQMLDSVLNKLAYVCIV